MSILIYITTLQVGLERGVVIAPDLVVPSKLIRTAKAKKPLNMIKLSKEYKGSL